MVERLVANEKVEGSTPFARSIIFSTIMSKINELNIKELFNLAISNQKKNDLENAKNIYKQILIIHPKFIEAYKNLGLIYQKQDKIEKAKKYYEKAIQFNPNLTIVQYNLALIFEQLGEDNKAITCYEKVIENNPNVEDAHNNLGLLFQKLGKKKESKNCYEKAIKINPSYANAYNNLGTLNADLGKYNEAIGYYSLALKYNNNVKSAKENIISALTFCKSNNDNSIVVANNSLKNIHQDLSLDEKLKNKNLVNLFKKSNKIIDGIKTDINEINYIETQTYRRNSQNLDCERHHEVFNQSNIIPKFCFSCFKIQIEPQNVSELIKLLFIFDSIKFPNNNWRKCMVELRSEVSGTYKGFIYCSSMDEVTEILNIIDPILKKFLKYKVSVKRGCSEFYELFSNFKETDRKSNNFMNYDDRWEKVESKFDIKKGSIQKKLTETIPGFSISDFLIINHWLNYAKLINDLSYKDISLDFLYSEHISQKISNQIEFRKKEFMC